MRTQELTKARPRTRVKAATWCVNASPSEGEARSTREGACVHADRTCACNGALKCAPECASVRIRGSACGSACEGACESGYRRTRESTCEGA
eukprot:6211241-Pleurochrysis_carterae.AAC.2